MEEETKPKYKNIPVDEETDEKVAVLCEAYEFPKRSKGALIRKLVNAEYEKLKALKLLPGGKGRKAVRELPTGE